MFIAASHSTEPRQSIQSFPCLESNTPDSKRDFFHFFKDLNRLRVPDSQLWSRTSMTRAEYLSPVAYSRYPVCCARLVLRTALKTQFNFLHASLAARVARIQPMGCLRFQCAFNGCAQRWWVWVDLNHRPRAYQARALTN